MPVSATAHIRPVDRGVAWIDETNTKVIEVALDNGSLVARPTHLAAGIAGYDLEHKQFVRWGQGLCAGRKGRAGRDHSRR